MCQKLCPKYLGPYEVIRVERHNRYTVRKVADGEGPRQTLSSADNMKLWQPQLSGSEDEEMPEYGFM